MQPQVQCLRCYKNIPVKADMVGQTILCPSCLERVYVSSASLETDKPKREVAAPANTPLVRPFASDVLARAARQDSGSGKSIGMGLGAVAAVGILLLLAVGLLMSRGGGKVKAVEADTVGALPPTTPVKAEFRLPPSPKPSQAIEESVESSQSPQPAAPKAQPTTVQAWTFRPSAAGVAAPWVPPGRHWANAGRWAEVWAVPDLAAATNQAVASFTDMEGTLRLSLSAAAADFPNGSNILTFPENEATKKLAVGVRDPIASVRLEGQDLIFSWAEQQTDSKLASQLMNCLVEINDGKQKRVGQLRTPMRTQPIALDLSDKHNFETAITYPPRASTLRLEITNLVGFGGEAKLRGDIHTTAAVSPTSQIAGLPGPMLGQSLPQGPAPGLGVAPPNAQLTIEFNDIPGLEIRLGFKEDNGKAIITTQPLFREDGREGDLSQRRLELIEEEAKRQLNLAQRELDTVERTLKTASEKLKKLKSNEPARASRRFPAWNAEHTEVTGNVTRSEKSVAELTARVDKLKGQVDSVPKLRALLKDSGQASIHYIVYSECGETDLLLIDARVQQ